MEPWRYEDDDGDSLIIEEGPEPGLAFVRSASGGVMIAAAGVEGVTAKLREARTARPSGVEGVWMTRLRPGGA
jgi:hypothetical protein